MTPVSSGTKQFHGAGGVSNADSQAMEEFAVYGLLISAALIVTGTVIGLVLRKRSSTSREKDLFGSVVKMPSAPAGLFPTSLYKQTHKPNYCSANDLTSMDAQCQDAGLAKDSASVQDWLYETDSTGSSVAGRGVQKWAVHFKMRYNLELQQLEVGLIHVSTIAVPIGDPTAYIFFNVYLMPHESEHKQSSLRQHESTTTVFEEKFLFQLRSEDAGSSILRISLYTIDGGRTRTCLGHVAQPLCGLHIFDGRVHFLTRDLADLETANMDGYLGETLVSLCYHMQKEKLKMRIRDCRNLPPQTPTDTKYYFQTDIVIGNQVVKTKKTDAHASLSQVFDCAYAFQIPCKHLDVCCFTFTVVQVRESDGQIVLERPWGKFTIGSCSYAHGTGVDHWKIMLSNSRKAIEMWHVISRAY